MYYLRFKSNVCNRVFDHARKRKKKIPKCFHREIYASRQLRQCDCYHEQEARLSMI